MRFTSLPERTPFCPDDSAVSALFEGKVGNESRERMLNHLASCPYCRAHTGVLSQLVDLSECQPPDALVAKAKQLAANGAIPSARRNLPRLVTPFMVAAVLMMAIGLFLTSDRWETGRSITQPADFRELRNRSQATGKLELLSPIDGSEIQSGPLEVQWRPAGDSLQYQISLLNEYGDLLLQEKVTENQVILDTEPMLQAGTKYFIHVSASLEDGRIIASPHVGFRVSNVRDDGS